MTMVIRYAVMTYTSMSTKYQVVIPKAVRNQLSLRVSQRFLVYERGGVIYLVPELPVRKLRGILKGSGVSLDDLRDKTGRRPRRS